MSILEGWLDTLEDCPTGGFDGRSHNFGIKFNMEEEDSWEFYKYSLGCLQFQTTNGFFVLFLFLVFESFQQRSCTS